MGVGWGRMGYGNMLSPVMTLPAKKNSLSNSHQPQDQIVPRFCNMNIIFPTVRDLILFHWGTYLQTMAPNWSGTESNSYSTLQDLYTTLETTALRLKGCSVSNHWSSCLKEGFPKRTPKETENGMNVHPVTQHSLGFVTWSQEEKVPTFLNVMITKEQTLMFPHLKVKKMGLFPLLLTYGITAKPYGLN